MSSTFLVFDSPSDFNLLTAAHSQGWIDVVIRFFLFGGDVVGLSIAIHYGASKIYAPTHNLATYHWILFVMAFCCDYFSEQKFKPNCLYARFLFLRMLRASRSKTWVIYHLIKSSQCCFWYRTFMLNPLKFYGITSSLALHHTICIILYNLVVIECFCWPLLDCYLLELYLVIECFRWPLLDCYLLELYLVPHPLDSPCVSHILLTTK
jgi:hypothetical protein